MGRLANGFGICLMSKPPPGVDFVLPGGVFESLAAMTDVEKTVADNTRSNGKKIRCLIISPVNIQFILTVDFLNFSIVHASSSLNK